MTLSSSARPRQLGAAGPRVFPIALGCMGMSGMYGDADEQESIGTIYAAIDRGINLIDTGDFYGSGHNEMLIGRALRGRRDKVLLSVKFGALRTPDGGWAGPDNRPLWPLRIFSHTACNASAPAILTFTGPRVWIPPSRFRTLWVPSPT